VLSAAVPSQKVPLLCRIDLVVSVTIMMPM
jgi:hypothetical protein